MQSYTSWMLHIVAGISMMSTLYEVYYCFIDAIECIANHRKLSKIIKNMKVNMYLIMPIVGIGCTKYLVGTLTFDDICCVTQIS